MAPVELHIRSEGYGTGIKRIKLLCEDPRCQGLYGSAILKSAVVTTGTVAAEKTEAYIVAGKDHDRRCHDGRGKEIKVILYTHTV